MSHNKFRSYKLRLFLIPLALSLLIAACSDDLNKPETQNVSDPFCPATLNTDNALDSVGFYHTGIMQAGFDASNLSAADTINKDVLWNAVRVNVSNLNNIRMSAFDEGRDTLDLSPITDWSDYLANYDNNNLT